MARLAPKRAAAPKTCVELSSAAVSCALTSRLRSGAGGAGEGAGVGDGGGDGGGGSGEGGGHGHDGGEDGGAAGEGGGGEMVAAISRSVAIRCTASRSSRIARLYATASEAIVTELPTRSPRDCELQTLSKTLASTSTSSRTPSTSSTASASAAAPYTSATVHDSVHAPSCGGSQVADGAVLIALTAASSTPPALLPLGRATKA